MRYAVLVRKDRVALGECTLLVIGNISDRASLTGSYRTILLTSIINILIKIFSSPRSTPRQQSLHPQSEDPRCDTVVAPVITIFIIVDNHAVHHSLGSHGPLRGWWELCSCRCKSIPSSTLSSGAFPIDIKIRASTGYSKKWCQRKISVGSTTVL
jgi:hypothetical protein